MPYEPKYENAWLDNVTTGTPNGQVEWKRIPLGELVLTTGAIVACDPTGNWGKPFTRTASPGRYPVIITTARPLKYDWKDGIAAYAMLELKPVQPVRWEMALIPGQDISELEDDEFWGYGVDGGQGSFMDVEAASILEEKMDLWLDTVDIADIWSSVPNPFFEPIEARWKEVYKNRGYGINYILNEISELNFIAFGSGYGDGSYPSYWGFDANNEIVCLLTDFCVVNTDTAFDDDGKDVD